MSRAQQMNRSADGRKRINLMEMRELRLSTQDISDQSKTRKHSAMQQNTKTRKRQRVKTQSQYRSQKKRASQFDVQFGKKEPPTPINIQTDKQKMYSELIRIKKINNDLEEENIRLKTKLKQDRHDKVKLLSQLSDHDVYHPSGTMQVPQTLKGNHLSIYLKQQLREEKEKTLKLEKQIEKYKKSTRVTKLSELQIQNQALREHLNNYISQLQSLQGIQNIVRVKEQEIDTLGNTIIQKDEEISKLMKKLETYKKAVDDLKAQEKTKYRSMQAANQRMQDQNARTVKKLHETQQRLAKLTKIIADGRHKTTDIKSEEDKHDLLKIIQEQQKQLQILKEKLQNQEANPQLVQRITQFLKLKLRAHHINHSEFPEFFTPYHLLTADKKISKKTFMNILSTDPFQLLNYHDKQQVCSFLFDSEEVPAQKLLVKMNDLLGSYTVDAVEDEDRMFIEICAIVAAEAQNMAAALLSRRNGQGTISKEELVPILSSFKFTQQQILFILTQISLDSLSLDLLNYYSIFDLFNQYIQGSNQINPVEQLSEEYDPSNSNTNLRKTLDQEKVLDQINEF